jgi:outer membrane protein TolC
VTRTLALSIALALALPSAARAQAPSAEPLTLEAALAEAARANADVAIARADADAAGADVKSARGGLLPRLDVTASAGRDFTGRTSGRTFIDPSTGETVSLPAQDASDQESYSASARLSQPLLDWGAVQDVRRAGASARAAGGQYDETRLRVAFDVTRLFHEVLRAERSLAVLEATVARSGELVARADALFAAGRAPRSETLQARVNLGNDRIAVEAQRVRAAQARTALAAALGRDGAEQVRVAAPPALDAPLAGTEPPPVAELVARAEARRPALSAQRALVEAAEHAVGGARAGYYPRLDGQLSYGRTGAEAGGADGVFGDPTRNYGASAEVVLSVNLFEGRRTEAAVQRAEVQARRARATQGRTREQVAKEIADARAAVSSLATRAGLAEANLALAREGLALATQRLEAGLASQLEVRDASLKLTQAELSAVEARIDHAVATADLSRAVGGAQ